MLILEIIRKMEDDSISRTELNQFIKECIRISFNFTRRYHQKVCGGLPLGEISLRDAAFDAVVPLFIKSSTAKYALVDSFKGWNGPLKTEEDAVIFLNKVVMKRTEQHITTLFQQADPLFAKILKSVNYYINSNGYIKHSHFGTVYICESGTEQVTGKVICPDHFVQLPFELFQAKTDLLLHSLFTHIKEKTDFFPAVPLNCLILRLKTMIMSESDQLYYVQDQLAGLEMHQVVDNELEEISNYISHKYNQKLTPDEIQAMRSALQELAVDLRDGGINRSLYEYLKDHMTNLDKDEYYSRYQNILDYLLRLLKKKVAAELRNSK